MQTPPLLILLGWSATKHLFRADHHVFKNPGMFLIDMKSCFSLKYMLSTVKFREVMSR